MVRTLNDNSCCENCVPRRELSYDWSTRGIVRILMVGLARSQLRMHATVLRLSLIHISTSHLDNLLDMSIH